MARKVFFWGLLLGILGVLLPVGQGQADPAAEGHTVYLPLVLDERLRSLQIEFVAAGLAQPTAVAHAGDDRLFVLERAGRIRIIGEGFPLTTPFLDIRSKVSDGIWEQGLLGLAFHPNYTQNGYFYITYTDLQEAVVLARYRVNPANPNQALSGSETILLTVPQHNAFHQGGGIQFGPNGYLYVGLGDGGDSANGQATDTLPGKMLRLDVDGGEPYAIPPDNPFLADPAMRDEVWATGLRNPWRFSFDALTGDFFMGDVGDITQEEVNFRPAAQAGGENYGWPCFEGTLNRQDARCNYNQPFMEPVFAYPHVGRCSVTGGYVYRGEAFPSMWGHYLFADFCSGEIFSLLPDGGGGWQMTVLADFAQNWSAFGQDVNGELYVVDYSGGFLFRLRP